MNEEKNDRTRAEYADLYEQQTGRRFHTLASLTNADPAGLLAKRKTLRASEQLQPQMSTTRR